MKKLMPFIILVAAFISACNSTTDNGKNDNYRTVPDEDGVQEDSIGSGNYQDNTEIAPPDTQAYMPK